MLEDLGYVLDTISCNDIDKHSMGEYQDIIISMKSIIFEISYHADTSQYSEEVIERLNKLNSILIERI